MEHTNSALPLSYELRCNSLPFSDDLIQEFYGKQTCPDCRGKKCQSCGWTGSITTY